MAPAPLGPDRRFERPGEAPAGRLSRCPRSAGEERIRLPDAPQSREEARARWRVAQDAFWVGCVARLEPVKNLPCLVRAAAALATALPGLRVSIFGTGSQDRALRDLIRALGAQSIVTLEGFDNDMAGTMAAFDCFVLSSLHEGLPMSLLEAMALGVRSSAAGWAGCASWLRGKDRPALRIGR